MAVAQDILLDEKEAPIIQNGDFVVGASDQQHIRHILKSIPGFWRFAPLVGANLYQHLEGPANLPRLRADIITSLKADNYDNIVVNLSADIENDESAVEVEASRTNPPQ